MVHLQNTPDGTQNEIEGATTSSYTLTINDIGFLVSVSCEPVRSDWARGPSISSEFIGPVLPGMHTLAGKKHVMFLKAYFNMLLFYSQLLLISFITFYMDF